MELIFMVLMETPWCAAENGHEKIVKLLLQKEARVNASAGHALHSAPGWLQDAERFAR
jgi:hypothetical protein